MFCEVFLHSVFLFIAIFHRYYLKNCKAATFLVLDLDVQVLNYFHKDKENQQQIRHRSSYKTGGLTPCKKSGATSLLFKDLIEKRRN